MTKEFQERIDYYQKKYLTLDNKGLHLSIIRFVLFAIGLTLFIYSANERNGTILTVSLLAFIILFGILIKIHNRIKFQKELSYFLSKVNEEELQRTIDDLSGLYGGDEYNVKDHFYAADIDLFGSNSLFQLIIRSRLERTQQLGARWMLNRGAQNDLVERQDAVRELTEYTDWRQKFTAFGMLANSHQPKGQFDRIEHWMADQNDFIEKPFWRIVGMIMPMISLALIIGIFFFGVSYQLLFIPIVVNLYLLKVTFNPLLNLTKNFDKTSKSIRMYSHLFSAIETADFSSPLLKRLKNKLFINGNSASKSIAKLGSILEQLQNRANMLYFPINMLFVLDLFWLRQGERWKRINKIAAKAWFDAVHEFDLLSDMASFAHANPDYHFPEIVDQEFVLTAESMGHPLINREKRICNSFEFRDKGFVGLVTGSNMSGKSTFLRTIGVNITMAQMGLPVCAKYFKFSLVQLFTGMRTSDNLEESVSSFYAELTRIKMLLDSINEDRPILYLLDEILKGTNSEDRHRGSISLVKQLSEMHVFGLISTHDLALADLEKESGLVKNYSFNSTIEGDEIIFDYRLTNGPCRSFNASKLMEKMGIIV